MGERTFRSRREAAIAGALAARIRGFSLVELMIAITLGLLLTAGMIQLFSGSRLTFQTTDGLARIQENGRFAMELLKRDLRQAGERGFCAGRLDINSHLSTGGIGSEDFFLPERAVVGWEFDGTGPGDDYTVPDSLDPSGASAGNWASSATSGSNLPGSVHGQGVVPGSDVLVIRSLQPIGGITGDPTATNSEGNDAIQLQGTYDTGALDDSLVLVTNCGNGADLFQNTSSNSSALAAGGGAASGPGNNTSVDWSTSYNDSMQAFQVSVIGYFVGFNAAAGTSGLYRVDLATNTTEELVEGAENLQILYGFSRAAPAGDGQSVNDWLTADQVPADGWEQVIAVRVGYTARSSEVADNDRVAQVFGVTGTDVTSPADGRLRVPFLTTIALRNRVLVL